MDFEKVHDWISAHAEQMVELQAELTSRPAIAPENGGKGEWEKARFLEGWLREHGLDRITHYDFADERVPEGTRPNLVVELPGGRDKPCVWVCTHMDVVPPGQQNADGSWEGWESDPFTLRRAGDMIVGRGVADDQQALVSSAFAALALVETGLRPAHTVRLAFVSDEETGNRYGLGGLLHEHGRMFTPEDVIIVPDGGNEDGSMIEVAEKSVLWLEFRVVGKQSHGSRPDVGINAFRAAAWLVNQLDEGFKLHFDKVDHLYEPPASTFEPTLHKANVPNVNTIPGEDVFCFDCRVLPAYGLDSVLDFVRAQCRRADGRFGTTTELTVRHRSDAAPATSPDHTVVRALESAIKEVTGVDPKPMGIGGMTFASLFRARGLPAAVWMTTSGTAHQANEVCSVAHMVSDASVFAHVYMNDF